MRKITLFVLAALMSASAFAQNNSQWGVKLGLNSASEIANNKSTDPRTGLLIGMFVECPVSSGVSVQPEFVYSQQGGKSSISAYSSATDAFNYINIPVILKLYIGSKHRWSIDLGPQVGFLISAKTDDAYGNKMDIYDQFDNKYDISFCLGVSYKFTEKFDISIRGNGGMVKYINAYDHRNSVGQLALACKF